MPGRSPTSWLRRLPEGAEPELLTVAPATTGIGAQISEIDLSAPIPLEVFAELDRALLEFKVLFFRDQHISAADHRDFARMWGELEVHPFLPQGEVPEIVGARVHRVLGQPGRAALRGQ